MSEFLPPQFYAEFYGLPPQINVPMGKSIEVAKQVLGSGITRMWRTYFENKPGPSGPYVYVDDALRMLRVCDYLAAVSSFVPAKSRRGVLSEHGLEEVRSLVLDFAGAPETERRLNFLFGYRVDETRPYGNRWAVFPEPTKIWADFDEKIDTIAFTHNLERIRFGGMEVLLDHGETELAVARWNRPKFEIGFHCNVAARVAAGSGSDPFPLAKEVMEIFDVMPYSFVTTMEHALF